MAALKIMANTMEVIVPDIGDFENIPIIELLVKPGDSVIAEQAVVTLESDKATLDVPTPVAGRVVSLIAAKGMRVSRGSVILTLEVDGVAQHAKQQDPAPHAPVITIAPGEPPAKSTIVAPVAAVAALELRARADARSLTAVDPAMARIHASPSIRRLGRELGADLASVTGSGRGGRILIEDVHKSVRDKLQSPAGRDAAPGERPAAKIDFSRFGPVERQPLARIRRISGPILARSWARIPHVTNFDEADITDLEALRVQLNKELGGRPKITLLPLVVKAVAATLQRLPLFNASLDGEELILKGYVNIGVAVDTPGGLVVPVVRGADRLGIIDIAQQLSELSEAARAGKLSPANFEGGCFTISSLGGVGGTGFTPIINAPEIAILGVAKAAIQARYDGAQFQPRLTLPLALGWDHRATDGVAAARFLVHLKGLLEDLRRVLLYC